MPIYEHVLSATDASILGLKSRVLLEKAEMQIHYSGQHFWAVTLVPLLAGASSDVHVSYVNTSLASLLTVFFVVKVYRVPLLSQRQAPEALKPESADC